MICEKKLKLKRFLPSFCFCVLVFAVSGYADDAKTDNYAPVYASPPAATPLKDALSRAIEFPFQILKWPVDQLLVYTEDYRLDKKTLWIYDRLVDIGLKPHLDSMNYSLLPSYGLDFDLVRLARQKVNYPDLIIRGWINHGPTSYFQVGTEIGVQRIGDTGFHVSGIAEYDNRRNENFYGIGPHSSRGDSTSYVEEKTTMGVKAGYEFSPSLDLFSMLEFSHVNIKDRAIDGKGDIPEIFPKKHIPGDHGDGLLSPSLGLDHDTRDSKEDATKGGYEKFLFKFTNGVQSSKACYFTYLADLARYFQLGSPKRILVTRFFGEFNQPTNDGRVPFYEMAKLGGPGMFPFQGSQTLRGFVYDRFYGDSALLLNIEYRYTVWQYKEFKMNTVLFWDEGEVSKGFSTFLIKDFQGSYGTGFYVSYLQTVLISFNVAHGNEGTKFYLENKLPF